MRHLPIDPTLFRENRKRLAKAMARNSLAVVNANDIPPRNADGTNPIVPQTDLFYLSGIILWNFFSDVLLSTASVVNRNAGVFGKVYFPRIIPVFADNAVNLVRFGVQLLLLLAAMMYYRNSYDFEWSRLWLMLPAVLCVNAIALGGGMLLSLATVRYRDINNFLQIAVRLLLFICPVFYSLTQVPPQYDYLIKYNPLTPPFEWFRLATINTGIVNETTNVFCVIFSVVIFISGLNAYKRYTANLIEIV